MTVIYQHQQKRKPQKGKRNYGNETNHYRDD